MHINYPNSDLYERQYTFTQGKNQTRQLKNQLMEKNGYKSGKSFKRAIKKAKRLQEAASV